MPRIEKNNGLDFLEYRDGSGGTVEVYDIAVMSQRGQGIGRSLVEELKTRVKTHLIFAITREGNQIARIFYLKVGFREVAFLKKFYDNEQGGRENAVMYGLDL